MNVNALINSTSGYIGSVQPGAHLAINSNVFLSWLQNTTNTLYNSWWSRASTPNLSIIPHSSINSYGINGNNNTPFSGMVSIPDGRTILIPFNACNVGIYNCYTNTLTQGASNTFGSNAFGGGVLLPNGNVCFAPYNLNNSNVVQYNPYTNQYQSSNTFPAWLIGNPKGLFNGAILTPDGNNVLLLSTGIRQYSTYNPNNGVNTNNYTIGNYGATSVVPSGSLTSGGVLLPNGNICLIPNGASNMMTFAWGNNYNNNVSYAATQYISGIAASNFGSGVLLPNGNVMMVPRSNNTTIGIYYANSNIEVPIQSIPLSTNVAVTSAYSGCTMLADGRVFLTPLCASNAGIYDYNLSSFSTLPSISNTYSATGIGGYNASILLPNGNVLMTPAASNNNCLTIVSGFGRPSKDLCYHPFYNRGGFVNY